MANPEVRRFTLDDLEEVNRWRDSYDEPPLLASQIPEWGFIVPHLACGFLYRAEAGLGFLENFSASPSAWGKDRSWALDVVSEEILRVAPGLGVTQLLALTKLEAIAQRAVKFGFHCTSKDSYLLVKRLGKQ